MLDPKKKKHLGILLTLLAVVLVAATVYVYRANFVNEPFNWIGLGKEAKKDSLNPVSQCSHVYNCATCITSQEEGIQCGWDKTQGNCTVFPLRPFAAKRPNFYYFCGTVSREDSGSLPAIAIDWS